jgi:hypothetical protein
MKFVTWNSVELETVSDVISRKVISGRLLRERCQISPSRNDPSEIPGTSLDTRLRHF